MRQSLRLTLIGLCIGLSVAACAGPTGEVAVEDDPGAADPPPVGAEVGDDAPMGSADDVTVVTAASNVPSVDASAETAPVPPDGAEGGTRGEVPREVIDILIDYAAGTLSVDPSDVAIESASPWSWPDTAFGCPEPGKTYDTVATEGYKVLLEARGQSLDLRVAEDGAITDCRLPEGRQP